MRSFITRPLLAHLASFPAWPISAPVPGRLGLAGSAHSAVSTPPLCFRPCCCFGLECLFIYLLRLPQAPYLIFQTQLKFTVSVFCLTHCPSSVFPQTFVPKAIVEHYMSLCLGNCSLEPSSRKGLIFSFFLYNYWVSMMYVK